MTFTVDYDSVAYYGTIDRLKMLYELRPEPYLLILIENMKNAKCRDENPKKESNNVC